MRQTLQNTSVRLLRWAETYPTWPAPSEDLDSMLRSLFPVTTDKNLVRLGPDGDGGYLVPEDLDDIAAVFSPGVSTEAGFEEDCARRGMDVFLADGSVDGPPVRNDRLHFRKAFLGPRPALGVLTLEAWVRESGVKPGADLLLQMDIEGDEYGVILTTPDQLLSRFRIMVVEFHSLHLLLTGQFFLLGDPVFRKVLEGHVCVHAHPNNHCGYVEIDGRRFPRMMEFTFLRRDRVGSARYATEFPHPLDRDNTVRKTLRLPDCWHSRRADDVEITLPSRPIA